MAVQVPCDLVKGASFKRDSHFRILAMSDQPLRVGCNPQAYSNDRIFIERSRTSLNRRMWLWDLFFRQLG